MQSRPASLLAREDSLLLSNNPVLPILVGSDFTSRTNFGKAEVRVTSILLGIAVIFMLSRVYVNLVHQYLRMYISSKRLVLFTWNIIMTVYRIHSPA